MTDWIIETTELGGLQPVTAEITAPSGSYAKETVETYGIDDPELPLEVYNAIQDAGLNCVLVLLLNVNSNGTGAVTFYITSAESNMLSDNPSGVPNGVVAVFDQSNSLCLIVDPTKGKIKVEYI